MRIFLNYRRDDLLIRGARHSIYDSLSRRFGGGSVFMDIDSIFEGASWREALEMNLGQADVVLALIGPQWEQILKERGRNRKKIDHVVTELQWAVDREKPIPVVPVLVGIENLPRVRHHSGIVAKLGEFECFPVDIDKGFRSDLDELGRRLETNRRIASKEKFSAVRLQIREGYDEPNRQANRRTFNSVLHTAFDEFRKSRYPDLDGVEKVLREIGLPPKLLETVLINDYTLPSNATRIQRAFYEFAELIYPPNRGNQEFVSDRSFLDARSDLAGWYDRIAEKAVAEDYLPDLAADYRLDRGLITALTWLDITHRKWATNIHEGKRYMFQMLDEIIALE